MAIPSIQLGVQYLGQPSEMPFSSNIAETLASYCLELGRLIDRSEIVARMSRRNESKNDSDFNRQSKQERAPDRLVS